MTTQDKVLIALFVALLVVGLIGAVLDRVE